MSTATPEAVNGDAPPISDPTDPEAAPERPPEPPQPDEQPMPDQDLPPDGDQPADTPPNEAEADLPNGEDHGDDDDPLAIAGSADQLSLDVGGLAPTISALTLSGAPNLSGEFEKGEVLTLELTVRVTEVKVTDSLDGEGNVKSTKRSHTAKVESARRTD
jgi:hypothetical protein